MRLKARTALTVLSVTALALFGSGTVSAGPFAKGPLVQVSGASPIAGCEGDTGFTGDPPGVQFVNSEVEPHVWVSPADPNVLVGGWQQDRWNNGGAEGNVTAFSLDGGASWSLNPATKSSICTGGTAANGGNYERASDPWMAISPNGNAYLMSLSTDTNPGGFGTYPNAMLVTRSTDNGATWEDPHTLIRDESPNVFNDKNSMTADPNDSNFVYAVWDRLLSPPSGTEELEAFENSVAFTGDIYFTRTTDAGESWEPARKIFKAGTIAQTIGNVIGVLPDNATFDGELLDVFTLIRGASNRQGTRGFHIATIRSEDHGATWSRREIIIDRFLRGVVLDPDDGRFHRTGDINPEVAVDSNSGAVYVVWQDNRFGPRSSIGLTRSTDGGLTWSPLIKVNQTPTNIPIGNQQAFDPMVAVGDDGTVSVFYYDFRNNTADGEATTPTDAFVVHCHAASEDCTDASSWGDETAVTDVSFDSRRAPVARGFFLGDYVGFQTDGASFFPFFTQSSVADPASIFVREVG
jgi:hypothetical protein